MTTDGYTKATTQIDRWVKARLKDHNAEDEIRLPDIATEAVEHFLEDRAFLTGPIGDLIRASAYDAAAAFVKRTRGLVIFEDAVISTTEAKQRAKRSPFFSWLEHAGDRHLHFLDMTREDLELAATERETRAETDLEVARLERALAERLEGGQRVRDRFSVEEIEAIRASLARQQAIKHELREGKVS